MNNIYLDYAAATPMSKLVLESMQPFFSDNFYNPSALYLNSHETAQALAGARSAVAKELGCKSSEVIFVSGGTESDNLAINGVMQSFHGKNMVYSAVEHSAVIEPSKQYKSNAIPAHEDGRINLEKLAEAIDSDTVLVSVMYANNEIGTVQPLREIAKIIKDIRQKRQVEAEVSGESPLPIYFHTDACQAANYLPLLVNTLGVDLMTLNGGKIYGPKQSGILFLRTGVELKPQILGGGQERGYRSGTENMPAIIGFAKALEETSAKRQMESERLHTLQQDFLSDITKKLPIVIINGSEKYRLPNNIHLTFPGQDNERLMMELDQQGILVATGSACSASSDEPSHVLGAIGLTDKLSQSSIRITLGRQSTKTHLDKLLQSLVSLVA